MQMRDEMSATIVVVVAIVVVKTLDNASKIQGEPPIFSADTYENYLPEGLADRPTDRIIISGRVLLQRTYNLSM